MYEQSYFCITNIFIFILYKDWNVIIHGTDTCTHPVRRSI